MEYYVVLFGAMRDVGPARARTKNARPDKGFRHGGTKMRKHLTGKFLTFALALLVTAAPAALSEGDEPPAIEKGWNLISTPCDVSLADIHQALGSDEIMVYSWDGSGYRQVDSLERARGYALNSNAVLNSSYLCDNKKDDTPVSLSLKKGWNLIGNPFHKAITFNDAFETNVENITAIYEYRGNRFVEIEPDRHLKPWRGYWVHALEDMEITYDITESPNLTKLYLSANKDSIQIHEHVSLWVRGTYSSTAGDTREDVTEKVTWVLDDEKIGYINEKGSFTPTALGVVSIYATLEGVKSNSVNIMVAGKQLKWLFLSPSPDVQILKCPPGISSSCYSQYAIEKGKLGKLEVYAIYNDNDWMQVDAGKVEWEVSNANLIDLTQSSGAVRGVSEGSARIRAYMDGVYSDPVWLHVYSNTTQQFLAIEYSNRPVIVKKGKKVRYNAIHYVKNDYGYFKSYEAPFDATTVTNEAAWHITDQSVATISAGTVTGVAAGRADIHATHAGLTSNSLTIEVWEPAEFIACEADNPNEQSWNDGTSIAILSADCDSYAACAPVTIQFTTAIRESSQLKDLNVCLDLYVYNDEYELVKTFRDNGCTPEPIFAGAGRSVAGFRTEYEYSAEWDLKDNDGNCVPAGKYYAVSRFYITYCPVIKVEFEITGACAQCGGSDKDCSTDSDCSVGGCSGQLCHPKSDGAIVTTCEWLPEYACTARSRCGCFDGICAWEPTDQYLSCLENPPEY